MCDDYDLLLPQMLMTVLGGQQYGAEQTLTLQPDATAGVDTFIDSATATTNYGTNVLSIGESNAGAIVRRTLIKFDLSTIPAGSLISSATLTLNEEADQADNAANLRRGVKTEQKVGTRQLEEVHAVALNDLTHVHQFTQEFCRSRRRLTRQRIRCLCRCKMMTHRADAANARRDLRHFKIQPPFAEFLKPAKLVDMHVGMVNRIVFLHMNGHFGVTFNAGYRLNRNFLSAHKLILILHSLYLMPVQQVVF